MAEPIAAAVPCNPTSDPTIEAATVPCNPISDPTSDPTSEPAAEPTSEANAATAADEPTNPTSDPISEAAVVPDTGDVTGYEAITGTDGEYADFVDGSDCVYSYVGANSTNEPSFYETGVYDDGRENLSWSSC